MVSCDRSEISRKADLTKLTFLGQATTSKQRLALAICDFLSTSLTDGTLQADDKDSIDVAINCIGEVFGVDPTDQAAVSRAIGSQNLLSVYSVYEKLKNNNTAGSSSASASSGAAPVPGERRRRRPTA